MTLAKEETASEAATSKTAKGTNMNLKEDSTPTVLLHLPKPGKSTGAHHVTYGGHNIDRSKAMTFVADIYGIAEVYNGRATAHLCRECIDARDAVVRAARRKEQEQKRLAAAREREEREERDVIKQIVGKDLHSCELSLFLVEAFRRGEDITKFVEAMKAVDDLQLQRAGLTDWGYDDDDI